MRTIILFLASLAIAAAQQTRVVTSHSPGDAKPNDPKVPDVYSVDAGKFDRVLIFRFKYQADLLAGLEQMVKQNHIQNGVILAAVGSVTGYQVHQVVNGTFPSKIMLEQMANGPADLISMNGYIINGHIHPHMTLGTPDRTIAGHLEPGTEVFTFAIITIGVMNDTDLSKIDDKTYR